MQAIIKVKDVEGYFILTLPNGTKINVSKARNTIDNIKQMCKQFNASFTLE